MISERTLKKWRKEALKIAVQDLPPEPGIKREYTVKELQNRILKMAQELLDQHLIRREK